MATQSVKTFINLYNYTKFESPKSPISWLKERMNIFWFTTENVISSPNLFPSRKFFAPSPPNKKDPFYMYTKLFLVQIQSTLSIVKPQSIELVLVCLHCTISVNTVPVFVNMANISIPSKQGTGWISTSKQLDNHKLLTQLHDSINTLASPVAMYGSLWADLTVICTRDTIKGSLTDWFPVVKALCGTNITFLFMNSRARDTFPGLTTENEISMG